MTICFVLSLGAFLQPQSHNSTSSDKDGGDTSPSSVWTTFASLNKARMKFNMKLLGQQFTLTSPRTPTASAKARMFVSCVVMGCVVFKCVHLMIILDTKK